MDMSKSKTTAPRETKVDILKKLLSRKAGADLAALQAATGWQAHSVRAALSGLRKAGYIIERSHPAKLGGSTVYRLGLGPVSPR
jgi:DNA-binding transcriptional regulator PaaX